MPALRVLALISPGRHGDDAIRHALALSQTQAMQLTVAALTPEVSGPRCGTSILDFNAAAARAAGDDLARARGLLRDAADYVVIREPDEGALARYVAERDVALVLLPGRRGRHPRARSLRGASGAEVRVVGDADR